MRNELAAECSHGHDLYAPPAVALQMIVWVLVAKAVAAALFVLYIPVHFIIKYW